MQMRNELSRETPSSEWFGGFVEAPDFVSTLVSSSADLIRIQIGADFWEISHATDPVPQEQTQMTIDFDRVIDHLRGNRD
jgi:hypothetical protein